MANTIHSGTCGRLVALLVASLFLLEPPAPLQAQAMPTVAPPSSLQIVILEGEGAINNIKERTAREPIVQVQDENHKPLAGAAVLFAIHGGTAGAGGAFAGGATSLTVVTDVNGVARAAGLLPNQIQGSWQIQVTASAGKVSTTTVIHQSNLSGSPQSPGNKPPTHLLPKPVTIVGGILVAGLIIGLVVANSNNNNGTTITTGTGTVGAPSVRSGIHIRF